MLSLTMQVPLIKTASHGMMVPLLGITITSPGTRSVDNTSSVSARGLGERGGSYDVKANVETQDQHDTKNINIKK